MVAQMPYQRSCIDIREHWYLELFQVLVGHLLRAPVRAHLRELAHDQPLNPRTRGLVVFLVGAVVADLRIGQDNNLPRVGGISEDFLVAGDGSIKNDFAVAFAFGAVAFASEDSPVFQRKDSLHSRSGGVDFKDFIRDSASGQAPNAAFVWKSRSSMRRIRKSDRALTALGPAYPSASSQTRPCRRYN